MSSSGVNTPGTDIEVRTPSAEYPDPKAHSHSARARAFEEELRKVMVANLVDASGVLYANIGSGAGAGLLSR